VFAPDTDADAGSSWRQLCCIDNAHDADVNSVAWHPTDPALLASGGDDGCVRLWRLGGGGGGGGGGAGARATE